MKIAPRKTSDRWYSRIAGDASVDSIALKEVPIECVVEMDLVELLHGDAEENYRPSLHMTGELVSARPDVTLPFGVKELAMGRGLGVRVDLFYDFDQAQLADLVNKGYFTKAFQVPEGMSGIPWELPGKADFLVVGPSREDEAPIVFMNVHDEAAMALNQFNSGHVLSGYFPDYSAEPEAAQQEGEATHDLQRTTEVEDVFSHVSFEQHQADSQAYNDFELQQATTQDEARRIVPDGVFSRLLAEMSPTTAPEPIVEETPAAPHPGSAADLYQSIVAPGVERALAPIAETTPETVETPAEELDEAAFDPNTGEYLEEPASAVEVVETTEAPEVPLTEDGFVDLGLPEPELVPVGEQIIDDAEHRASVERNAARLRAGLILDEEPAAAVDEAQPGL